MFVRLVSREVTSEITEKGGNGGSGRGSVCPSARVGVWEERRCRGLWVPWYAILNVLYTWKYDVVLCADGSVRKRRD